jgi:hypothetical protein
MAKSDEDFKLLHEKVWDAVLAYETRTGDRVTEMKLVWHGTASKELHIKSEPSPR